MKKAQVLPVAFLMTAALHALEIHAAVAASHRSLRASAGTSLTTAQEQVIGKLKASVLKKNAELKYGHFTDSLKCGITVKVGMNSDKDEECPSSCPYFAQDLTDDEHCTYVCVKAEECAGRNPNRPIADTIETKFGHARKVCRAPYAQHCKTPKFDGTDTCEVCQSGYYLNSDGGCTYKFMFVIWGVLALVVVLLVIVIVWLVDVFSRPNENDDALKNALDNRGRGKLHQPRQESGSTTEPWPLDTNLLQTVVAGPGMMLHFNFIFVSIVWALLVWAVWLGFCIFHNELFILGTRRFGTPRENCILVSWGYHTQQRLMWTKVGFLVIVYAGSFALSLLHGVRQLRQFQSIHENTSTMNDFVALLNGLPPLSGKERVENDVQKSMVEAGIQKIVGLSICWDYQDPDTVEFIQKAAEEDVLDREKKLDSRIQDPPDANSEPKPNAMRKFFMSQEIGIFGTPEDSNAEQPSLVTQLETMSSTDRAFVVFETEQARDAAIEKGSFAFVYGGMTTTVEIASIVAEPDTVYWGNLGADRRMRIIRGLVGVGKILLALLFWTVCFYCPYAWSVFTWNYENGNEPPAVYGLVFTMVVVVGNAIMYQVCSDISDGIRFFYRDDRECFYMISYLIACMFNTAVDAISTYYMSYYIMTGLNFRTWDGTRLENVPTFTERFETYAIQRHLAESVYAYAWPSTFLVPFVIEPCPTILGPLWVGMLMIAKNKYIRGRDAQANVASIPMDLGRYSDVLLNMLLGVLMFYFPGGYMTTLFPFMAISHVWIYAFDHWKVLRNIPQCTYVSMQIDVSAQLSWAAINGIILSCLVFKLNSWDASPLNLEGATLVWACFGAWLVHTVLHVVLILYFVPMFGKKVPDQHMPNETYKALNQRNGCSWFTANPVHCLRSRHIYNHNPPCVYYVAGRDHLLEINESLGCYFTKVAPEAEDYSIRGQLGAGMHAIRSMSSRTFKKNTEPTKDEAKEGK